MVNFSSIIFLLELNDLSVVDCLEQECTLARNILGGTDGLPRHGRVEAEHLVVLGLR